MDGSGSFTGRGCVSVGGSFLPLQGHLLIPVDFQCDLGQVFDALFDIAMFFAGGVGLGWFAVFYGLGVAGGEELGGLGGGWLHLQG